MAITIKKTKLTVKTGGINEPEGAAGTAAPRGPAFAKKAPAYAVSYTFFGICGLLAVLLFAGLVLIQSLEIRHYHMYPSVFPLPVGTTVPVASSALPATIPAAPAEPAPAEPAPATP
jgi:hypothetical protein